MSGCGDHQGVVDQLLGRRNTDGRVGGVIENDAFRSGSYGTFYFCAYITKFHKIGYATFTSYN